MIKNERQFRITQALAARFRTTLNELTTTARPKNVHPRLWEAQRAGVQSQLRDLEAQLRRYRRLKSGGPKTLDLNSLDALPKMLIEARIAAGLTQADLAERSGLKPQQIQRYEASDYQTANLARLLGIARVINLHVGDGADLAHKIQS